MPQTARQDHLVSVRAIDQDPISSLRHHPSTFLSTPHTILHHHLPLVPTRHLPFHITHRYHHAATTHSLPPPTRYHHRLIVVATLQLIRPSASYICCLALRPPTQIARPSSFERPAISQQWLIRRRLKASTHRPPHLLFFPAIARGTTRLSGTTIGNRQSHQTLTNDCSPSETNRFIPTNNSPIALLRDSI